MSSIIGDKLKISIFGQSHGPSVGVVIDGLPHGEAIDESELAAFLSRRAPGRNSHSSRRLETDTPRIVSGLYNDKTCGAPLCVVIDNVDAQSRDYRVLAGTPRPGHADYPAHIRYGGHNDPRGGGHFSGRLTAPLCAAGGIAMQILHRRGVIIGAHLLSVGGIADDSPDYAAVSAHEVLSVANKPFPVINDDAGEQMRGLIGKVAAQGDSVGGVVECFAIGMPPGIGDPMFGGVENRLSAILFGIPAVKGLEFGAGFGAANMRGSAHNDDYRMINGKIETATNRHGGILGGITTGMPIVVKAAFKPTPSIALAQATVDLSNMRETTIEVSGRHDPCIAPRAVPCVEAAVAIGLLDMLL